MASPQAKPILALMLALSTFCSCVAQGKPLNQDTHRRILFLESWKGSYLISTYMAPLNVVRFEACGVKAENSCEKVATVLYNRLDHFQGPMLEMLHAYRKEVAQKADSSLWYFLSGGAKKSRDVQALDQIIREIETEGLSHWLLLLDKSSERQDTPRFSTPAFAHDLMTKMKAVFESYPADPEKCQ